jgi:hypothetical protein
MAPKVKRSNKGLNQIEREIGDDMPDNIQKLKES